MFSSMLCCNVRSFKTSLCNNRQPRPLNPNTLNPKPVCLILKPCAFTTLNRAHFYIKQLRRFPTPKFLQRPAQDPNLPRCPGLMLDASVGSCRYFGAKGVCAIKLLESLEHLLRGECELQGPDVLTASSESHRVLEALGSCRDRSATTITGHSPRSFILGSPHKRPTSQM